MSDTFDHFADAVDNYIEEDWDGFSDISYAPNPFMPFIGKTPNAVSRLVRNTVNGGHYNKKKDYWFGSDYSDEVDSALYFSNIPLQEEQDVSFKKKNIKTITCKNCRQSEFHWEQRQGKWRLYSHTGEVHSCYMTNKQEQKLPSNITKGNYKFIFQSDHVEDWCVVQYKGREIGRVLYNQKWEWFSHYHVDIPENVCQAMQTLATLFNETTT